MTRPVFGEVLRGIRREMQLSQAEFAAKVREAGRELGDPNACNKRLVQKWESGEHGGCRPNYRRALARVTGLPDSVFNGEVQEAADFASGYRPSIADEIARITAQLTVLAARLEAVREVSGVVTAPDGSRIPTGPAPPVT